MERTRRGIVLIHELIEETAGPFAADGATFVGSAESLPVDEGDLLVQLDGFVSTVDTNSDGQVSRTEWETYFKSSSSGASGSRAGRKNR